jgi:hypothetical protein
MTATEPADATIGMFPQPGRNAPASPGGLNLQLIVLTTRSSVALRKSLRFWGADWGGRDVGVCPA